MNLPSLLAYTISAFCLFLGAASLHLSRAKGWREGRWIAAIGLSSSVYLALDIPVTLSVDDYTITIMSSVQTFAAGIVAASWTVYSQLLVGKPKSRVFSLWSASGIISITALCAIPGAATTGRVIRLHIASVNATYSIVEANLLGHIMMAIICLVFLALSIRFAIAWRRKVYGSPDYCIAFGLVFMAAINDSLVWSGATQMPLVVDLFYIVPIAVAVLSMIGRVVRDANVLAELSAGLEAKVKERTLELMTSEARHRTTLTSIGDGLITTDVEGCVVLMNPIAEKLTGWVIEDALGRPVENVFRIVHARTREEAASPVARALKEGVVVGLANHTLLISRDGTELQIADSCAPIRDAEGLILGVVLVFRDVSEDYRRREMLRTFKESVENSTDAIGMSNPQGGHFYQNEAFECLFGKIGEKPIDAVYVDKAVGEKVFETIMAGGQWTGEVKMYAEDSRILDILLRAYANKDKDGDITALVGIHTDITDRKRAEEALQESEERYRTIIETAGEGILVADVETKAFLYCNRLWHSMFGYSQEEVPHLGLPDLYPEDARPRVVAEYRSQLRGERRFTPDIPCRRKDGSIFFADVRTTSVNLNGHVCIVVFFTDVSERQEYEKNLNEEKSLREKAEIELRHSQKLEAVGQLAAGIAHEINTPTQFIGDNVQFLADSFGELRELMVNYRQAAESLTDSREYESTIALLEQFDEAADLSFIEENIPAAIESALDGISRISTIVLAMKEFAHPDQREKSPSDLNKALQTTLTIARNEYKYVAEAEVDFGELPMVMCHISDLNQVFLNLLVNAAHAISDVKENDGDKGIIRARTRQCGNDVRIEISDTGCGIPEEIQGRVFDPFFTTKEVGRGSGQGLAIARSIVVDKHGGSLTFESEVGKGTTFIVLLPIFDGPFSEDDHLGPKPDSILS